MRARTSQDSLDWIWYMNVLGYDLPGEAYGWLVTADFVWTLDSEGKTRP